MESAVASVRDVFELTGNDELEAAEQRYLAPAVAGIDAVIIAASRGAALGVLTADTPKCMIDVRGEPLLRRLVSTLKDGGIRGITVVRGYRKEAISLPSIETVDNDAYESTGEAASLACAAATAGSDDHQLRGRPLPASHPQPAPQAPGDLVVVVDALGRRRADDPARVADLAACSRPYTAGYLDEEEPVWLHRIGHELPAESVHGECIGLAKLSARGAGRMRDELEAMGADGSLEGGSLPDVFTRLIAADHQVGVVYVVGGWLDVDDAFDLARARNFL